MCAQPARLSVVVHTIYAQGTRRSASREFRRIGDIAINPGRAKLNPHPTSNIHARREPSRQSAG
jgi:hypothetical protein